MVTAESGGRVVYSTCSLEREENSDVIERVLADERSFRLVSVPDELKCLMEKGELAWSDLQLLTSGPYLRTMPGVHPCDGFFASILEKVA